MRSPLDDLAPEAIPLEEEQAISLRSGFGLLAAGNFAFCVLASAAIAGDAMPGGVITSWVVGAIACMAMFGLLFASLMAFGKAEEFNEAADLRGSWICLGVAGLALIMILRMGDTPSTLRIWMLMALAGFFALFGNYVRRRATLTMSTRTAMTWFGGALVGAAIPVIHAAVIGDAEWPMLQIASHAYILAFPILSVGFFTFVWKSLAQQVDAGLWHKRDEIVISKPRTRLSAADIYSVLYLGRRPSQM